MSANIPHVTLNNGGNMPLLGFGVFQVPAEETERVVIDALAAGYRHLDTAAVYGNEEAVGAAIKRSGIPREELFVTTKLWVHDGGEEDTKRAFDASMKLLDLDYLDLYLIHQPYGDYYSYWRAMQDLYRQGLIRAIGVSNFYPDRLVDLIENNGVTPAVNQVETHPYFQRADYQTLMAERGVQIESWGPLAEGRNNIFGDPTLTAIGKAHGKSVAQVGLRWLVQRGVIVIPKSVRPERTAENLDVFDFALTEDEMSRIAESAGCLSTPEASPSPTSVTTFQHPHKQFRIVTRVSAGGHLPDPSLSADPGQRAVASPALRRARPRVAQGSWVCAMGVGRTGRVSGVTL